MRLTASSSSAAAPTSVLADLPAALAASGRISPSVVISRYGGDGEALTVALAKAMDQLILINMGSAETTPTSELRDPRTRIVAIWDTASGQATVELLGFVAFRLNQKPGSNETGVPAERLADLLANAGGSFTFIYELHVGVHFRQLGLGSALEAEVVCISKEAQRSQVAATAAGSEPLEGAGLGECLIVLNCHAVRHPDSFRFYDHKVRDSLLLACWPAPPAPLQHSPSSRSLRSALSRSLSPAPSLASSRRRVTTSAS